MPATKTKGKAKGKSQPGVRKFTSAAKRPAPPQRAHWLAPQMTHITPYLSVRDGMAALAFYEKAFGFKRRFQMKTTEGRLRHGEMEHGDSVIMIGEPMPQVGYKAPADIGGSPVALYVYVQDVDATAEKAKAAGATVVQEPKDQFYGDRTCELVDPEGHRWSIATHVKDVKPEELKG
jgi:PhnB protein